MLPPSPEQSERDIRGNVATDKLTNGFVPQSIVIDYEQSCISAIPNVYPNTLVSGCLVQNEGLQQQFINDRVFRSNILMIAALAFVPIADIVQSFDDLCMHCVGNE